MNQVYAAETQSPALALQDAVIDKYGIFIHSFEKGAADEQTVVKFEK